MNWIDATSYSRDQRGIIEPRTWSLELPLLRITVTRHIDYRPDEWLLRCYGVVYDNKLVSKNIEDAKAEALDLVRVRLRKMLASVEGGGE